MAAMLRAKQKRQAQLQADQADACVVDLKGHCHLPNIQNRDVVPSNRLLGRVYRRKLHEVVCRKDMFRIWNALGTSIASTMLQGKGVRFDGVLDLTFDIEGQPMYKLEKDQNVILKTFGSGHHALWRAAHDFLPGDGAPVLATLPLESVAQSLNRRREERRKKRESAGVTTDTLQLSRHGMGGFERTSSTFGSDTMSGTLNPPKKQFVVKTRDHVKDLDREVVLYVVKSIMAEFILCCRGPSKAVALTLERVGEFVYTSPEVEVQPGTTGDDVIVRHEGGKVITAIKKEGLGGRGFLAVRFRRDFIQLLQQQHAATVIRRPISRWSEARRHDKVTVREFLDPTVIIPGKLLEAPGFEGTQGTRVTDAARATLKKIRETLVKRQDSPYALHYFVKQLSTIDDDGAWDPVENKYEVSLDADELRWGLREFGVEVELEECLAVVAMFDADGGGTLSAKELMCGLRDKEMSALRKARVEKKWAQLRRETSTDEDEDIPVGKLKKRFNPHGDQRVKEGNAEWPPRDVMNAFFAVLDDEGDGFVGWKEFFELYENCSAAVPSDQDFLKCIEDYWHRPPSFKSVARAALATQSSKRTHAKPVNDLERKLDRVLDGALGMTVDDHTLDAVLDEGVQSRKENARPFSHHENRAPASPEPDLDVDYMNPGEPLASRAPPLRSGR
jgi:hypothetical protein